MSVSDLRAAEKQFSVCQFFEDGTYEYVRRYVDAKEAVKAAHHYCTSVGAKLGTTKRVIVTDGGDCIAFEWKHGEGVVFPLPPKS
jgi:Rad3-related DNA helicase